MALRMTTRQLYRMLDSHKLVLAASAKRLSNVPVLDEEVPSEFMQEPRKSPKFRGITLLKNSRSNKGLGFTLEERQVLGLHGLLPPAFMSQDQQVARVMDMLRKHPDDIWRYVYLTQLQDRNERLFFRVLDENVEELMPIVYTPTVGEACRTFGFLYRKPKGLYVTIYDKKVEQIEEIFKNWPEEHVRAIVVTDGERILGLGDLGSYGMGIPVGKLSLYVALAGVQPKWCLPVTLDVGTNNRELLDDPFYIGLRQRRVRGEEYDDLIDNFMQAVVNHFGQSTLIQFEDFGNLNAFRLLEKYRDSYCTFNDDIQGTASVALAGLMAATRITKKPLSSEKILFWGAGEASIGIGQLICVQMMNEGLTMDQAKERIWMIDSKGLLVKSRTDMSVHKQQFAHEYKEMANLEEIVEDLKPSAIIGAATIPQTFTERIVRAMAAFNERPIVFALSNPTSKAECTAEQAYTWSEGRALYASGSPFDPVTLNGKTYHPGQGNNSYVFPGVALGITVFKIQHATDQLFLLGAKTLANMVTEKHLEEGRLFPPMDQCKEISVQIAAAIAEYAYKNGLASVYPEPEDKVAFVRAHTYEPSYECFLPERHDWPREHRRPEWRDRFIN